MLRDSNSLVKPSVDSQKGSAKSPQKPQSQGKKLLRKMVEIRPRCFFTGQGLEGTGKMLSPRQQSQLVTGLNAYLAQRDGGHYASVEL